MTRSMYRKSGAWRLLAVYVAVVFILSMTGVGYAVPAPLEPVLEEPALEQAPPTPELPSETPSAEPADTASDVAPEVDPAPSAELPPVTAPPLGETAAPVANEATWAEDTNATSIESSGRKAPPLAAGAPITRDAPTAAGGGGVNLTFEGYRSSQSKWIEGNLGNLYREGDWVPYRLVVYNGTDSQLVLPDFAFKLDHYVSTRDAVGVDATRFWRVSYSAAQPAVDDPPLLGGSGLTATAQDVPDPSGSLGSAPFIRTSFPAGLVTIPAGEYGIIYFQAHLALTAYWNQQDPSRDGSGYISGSSLQARVDITNVGDKTVPIPVPPQPEGRIEGVKFNDLDKDGVRDPGEPGLGGWSFHLHGGPEGFPLDIQATSGADGSFAFGPLPSATYSLIEDLQEGWTNSTPNPLQVVVGEGSTVPVEVGNYRPDVTKTFELSVSSVPDGVTFLVVYAPDDGQPVELALTGSGPYTRSVDVPYGSTITSLSWYALIGGDAVLLGSMAEPETLTADVVNEFAYDSSVAGVKFDDADTDGERDGAEVGLAGWVIQLHRVTEAGPSLYAETITGPDGAFSFAGVLPGTYFVTEIQEPGWYNTVAPSGTFAVANGTSVTGLDFGNVQVRSALEVQKVGPSVAHVGDTVTYTVTLTNTGNTALYDVTVSDPLLGGTIAVVPVLAASQVLSWELTHVVSDVDPDPLPNTVTAIGTDLLDGPVVDEASWTVDIVHPAITVEKAADRLAAVVGDEVTYTFTVTNTGDVTLYDISVDDDHLGHVGDIPELASGESTELAASAVLTTTTNNVVAAAGTDETGYEVSDSDELTVPVYDPSVSIVKTVSAGTVLPGTHVTYYYAVTNTGDIGLFDLEVADDVLGYIGTIATLAPGETVTLEKQAVITVDVVNVATVYGHYGTHEDVAGAPHGHVTAQADADVDVVNPAILVVKSSDAPTEGVVAGTEVTYTFTVTNTGDVTLYGISVYDDHLGHIGDVAELASGESTVLAASAVLDESTTNVVVATGRDEAQHEVSDTDTHTVDVFLPFTPPDLSVEKAASVETADAGDVVTYTVTYRNVGEGVATDFTITDDFDERYVSVVDAGGGTVSGGTIVWTIPGPLDPGEAGALTYVVKVADDMPTGTTRIDNVVVISHPDDPNPDNDTDTERVTVFVDEAPRPAEPFLPFTGGEIGLILAAALSAAIGGLTLRKLARAR